MMTQVFKSKSISLKVAAKAQLNRGLLMHYVIEKYWLGEEEQNELSKNCHCKFEQKKRHQKAI